jgi:hypothetical protein
VDRVLGTGPASDDVDAVKRTFAIDAEVEPLGDGDKIDLLGDGAGVKTGKSGEGSLDGRKMERQVVRRINRPVAVFPVDDLAGGTFNRAIPIPNCASVRAG